MTSKLKVNLINDSGDNNIITSDGSGNVTLNSTLGNFTSTGIDDNASSTAITIDSSQNVGIGTSAPAHNVEIVATASGSINDSLQIRNNATATGTGSRIRFINSTDKNSDTNGAAIASVRNVDDNDLVFETENSERMRIDSSGNLGIGTTSPTDLLDVRGSIKARDASDNVGRFHTRNAFTVTNGTAVQLTSVCGSAIVCVSCNTTGAGGLFWGTFSTTVSKLAGDGLTSDSGTSDIAVYKSSSSNLMYFKNRSGYSRDYVITVYAARHA